MWTYGNMNVWVCSVWIMVCGCVGMWLCSYVDVWVFGHVEIWVCGGGCRYVGMSVWECGYMGI